MSHIQFYNSLTYIIVSNRFFLSCRLKEQSFNSIFTLYLSACGGGGGWAATYSIFVIIKLHKFQT